jgi:hypothetical protein
MIGDSALNVGTPAIRICTSMVKLNIDITFSKVSFVKMTQLKCSDRQANGSHVLVSSLNDRGCMNMIRLNRTEPQNTVSIRSSAF